MDEGTTIFINASDSLIQNITFEGDSLGGYSPFLMLNNSADIQHCTFQNITNGTCYCGTGYHNFYDCTFTGCNDGCIQIDVGYEENFTNCTFTNNTNTQLAGGVFRNQGSLVLNNCLLTDNESVVDGGAIFNYSFLTISGSKIYGNTADGNPSDIASRCGEEDAADIFFLDNEESLNALFADDGYTVEWQTENINSDKYGNYTKYTLQLIEIPGEEPEQPTDPGTEEPSTPSEPTEPTQPEQPSEPSTPTDSGSNNNSSGSSNTPSGGGTSSSSSNPSNDSSNSFRIDEPLGNVENNINIDNPSQYPSEIHISGNLGGSGGNQGNIPLQQTINVGSQEQPSEASTESGDKNITLSLNLGDAAELGSAFLLFKAAMLAIIFGVFAMLGIVVITILKKK